MARRNPSDRGASRRPTRTGSAGGRRPTGAHRAAHASEPSGVRRPTTRSAAVAGRRTTRGGEAVRPKNNTPLLLGGLAIGIVVVVVVVAIAAGNRGRGAKKENTGSKQIKASDFRPEAAPRPRAAEPLPTESRPAASSAPREQKPQKTVKPASFYQGMVDMDVWAEAQRLAAEGNRIARDLKDGKLPAGMTKEQAVRRAKECLSEALDKGNVFLEPVEQRQKYEDVEHFTAAYNETLLRWSRQMRAISFGGGH